MEAVALLLWSMSPLDGRWENSVARPAQHRISIVIGVGRSGTSLVQAMLSAHPEIGFLPETHFFRRYVGSWLPRMRIVRQGPTAFLHMLEEDRKFDRSGVEPAELLHPFLKEPGLFDLGRVYKRLLQMVRERRRARVVGDKDPRLIDFLPVLDDVLPDVRVIHVVRDPRDVLMSRRKAAWSRDRSDWSHVLTYRAQMDRAKRTGPRFLGDRYLEVRYEDLLHEPKSTLTEMCRHVDLEYDAAMMSFSDEAEELVADDEWQWKKETTGPLMRDNMRKWEGKLEPAVRHLVEKLCIDPFPELGYAPAKGEEVEEGGVLLKGALPLAELLANGFSRVYPLRTLAG